LNKRTLIFLLGLAVLISALLACGGTANTTNSNSPTSQQTQVSTTTQKSTPAPQPVHFPPKTVADLHGLAAKGNASTIHAFHSESVGLASCPQPKLEATVAPNVTGQQLASDLLAYFYAQHLDNDCGSVVFAYHKQQEAGDAYTVGRVLLDVTGSTHKLTLDTGGALSSNQEYIVTY